MVLRIEKVSDRPHMILRLSGRLQSEHVDQLKAQIEGSTQRVILDLEEVKLVDRDAVRFSGSARRMASNSINVLPTFATGLTGKEQARASREPSCMLPHFFGGTTEYEFESYRFC